MNKNDIFTIIKNGYVPANELMAYAKSKGYDLDGFKEEVVYNEKNELSSIYRYNAYIPLLWDGDSYDIICYIDNPDIDNGETTIMVRFICDMNLQIEENRVFPVFPNIYLEYPIKTCEDFIETLDTWDLFVGESYIKIISHRLAVLNDLDNIAENDRTVITKKYTKRTIKSYYKKIMNEISNQLLTKVDDIINFKDIVEVEEEPSVEYNNDMNWLLSCLKNNGMKMVIDD